MMFELLLGGRCRRQHVRSKAAPLHVTHGAQTTVPMVDGTSLYRHKTRTEYTQATLLRSRFPISVMFGLLLGQKCHCPWPTESPLLLSAMHDARTQDSQWSTAQTCISTKLAHSTHQAFPSALTLSNLWFSSSSWRKRVAVGGGPIPTDPPRLTTDRRRCRPVATAQASISPILAHSTHKPSSFAVNPR